MMTGLRFETLPKTCPACGAERSDFQGWQKRYRCGLELVDDGPAWIVWRTCMRGMETAIDLRAEVARLTALLKEAQPLLYDQAETASYFGNEPSDLHERIAAELAAPSGAADPEQ